MPKAKGPDLEARIRAEVERAVAPYLRKTPAYLHPKLRELAERYYREHPQASRILQLLDERERERSGTKPIAAGARQDGEDQDATGTGSKERGA
jgi:hypothetical protein